MKKYERLYGKKVQSIIRIEKNDKHMYFIVFLKNQPFEPRFVGIHRDSVDSTVWVDDKKTLDNMLYGNTFGSLKTLADCFEIIDDFYITVTS